MQSYRTESCTQNGLLTPLNRVYINGSDIKYKYIYLFVILMVNIIYIYLHSQCIQIMIKKIILKYNSIELFYYRDIMYHIKC